MIRIVFHAADGSSTTEAFAHSGERLLEVAQNYGVPLEGTCEGSMACSTCHVVVLGDHLKRLPKPSEEEEDILDFAANVTAASRLACQIRCTQDLDGMELRLPRAHRNLLGQ